MANAHRLAWIDSQIRAGAHPNAATIAARFEISRRQAARDLEYLRYSMGAPIEYSPRDNGYRYTDATFALPSLVVTDPERSALAFLAESYESLRGEAAERVAGVLRRMATLAVTDHDDSTPVVAVQSSALDAIAVFRRAASTHRKVETRYRGPDGVVLDRTLWPYAVVTTNGTPSCVAYCEELGLTHTFAAFRFERAELTTTEFDVPADLYARDWTRATLQAEPFVAVVRLEDPHDAERLEDAVLLDAQGLVRIEFFDSRPLISALLSCPSAFEVLAPRWLRQRITARVERVLALHLNEPR